MLVTDEDADRNAAYEAFKERANLVDPPWTVGDAFDAAWAAGRAWEQAYRAAIGREMSGVLPAGTWIDELD